MRKLIVCCDGTWNTPDQESNGVVAPTNVVRLRNCLAETDAQGISQTVYYHPGVGTEGGLIDKALGGGTGKGLGKNIRSAYKWLATEWQPGDLVFLFGFSRGAFTVRSLTGMLNACGLIDPAGLDDEEIWERIEALYDRVYRDGKAPNPKQRLWAYKAAYGQPFPIRFLGVWDTVGAMGIPDDLALLNLFDDREDHVFHDTELSPGVQTARHALALDERRAAFTPTRWTNLTNPDAHEVWFPGVHSDVGGGYAETGLSDGALLWMVGEAATAGLAFVPAMTSQIKPNPRDLLHNSYRGVFSYLSSRPRKVPNLDQPGIERLHSSVADRRQVPPITQAPYRPTRELQVGGPALTIDIFANQEWNETGIYLDKAGTYEVLATGEWLDADIPAPPKGTKDGKFHAKEILNLAGSLWGKFEGLYKWVTGNPNANLQGTRRHENFPWMRLLGAVANDLKSQGPTHPAEHEIIDLAIDPPGQPVTVTESGYLYAFANDAWNFYGNNRGSVRLTIRRLT